MRIVKVATCSLNQWAMDFDNNINNIKESIRRAKEGGAAIRLGPELEITGYGCQDHFFEQDTITHAWECLKEILAGDWTDGILCSFGMPVSRGSERYNCQVLCLNRKIVMIRPKMWLANGGGCAELRWFTAWKQNENEPQQLQDFLLPADIAEAISQTTAPFGYGYIQFLDTAVAGEICMELFSPVQIHPQLALNGVEIFMNASGSIHLLQKMDRRLRTITTAMSARGGLYMYSNHLGCDGARVYYDGCSCIVANGDVVALGQQFSLKDVDMVFAQVDLDKVSNLRGSNSSCREQASCKIKVPSIFVPYKLCHSFNLQNSLSTPLKIKYPSREEEIAMGAACWLWNYLRRSGASGFLLPFSGGVDTSSVAAIVGCMCQLVVKEIGNGDEQVKGDAMRIGNYKDGEFPTDTKEFAKRIFYTVFMGSDDSCEGSCSGSGSGSSSNRRARARAVAEEIGSWHLDVTINGVVSALLSLLHTTLSPHKKKDIDKSTLEKMQSRTRMVVAFMLASLLPWFHHKSAGFYLVLSSTTADQALCGNLTKYGYSSGDLNPIGSINNKDLGSFLKWAAANLGYSSLLQLHLHHEASHSHSLLEMSDEQLSTLGRLRKTLRCGPVSMFENLCEKWSANLSPKDIAEKVKHFFNLYAINRHKMTVLTPSYLVESHSSDDNRFDQRQFLYNKEWTHQFRKIDQLVQQHQLDGDEEALAGSNDI